MFTKRDRQQFSDKGIPLRFVEEQLAVFQRGLPFMVLDRPCSVGDGITRLSSSEVDFFPTLFDQAQSAGRISKFVPASGAASRMFNTLLAYRKAVGLHLSGGTGRKWLSESDSLTCQEFFEKIELFAFFDDLATEMLRQGLKISQLIRTMDYLPILDHLLFSPGLSYSQLPKALIKFHRYPQYSRTPLEEHVYESLEYVKDSSNVIRLQFTISPEHRNLVDQYIQEIRRHIEKQSVFLEINVSQQKSSTETLAVDLENQPFRGADGSLVFRPGGHGALLENLSNSQGDIVFIKNIDNVVHDRLKSAANRYKKVLGGYFIKVQNQVFSYLNILMGQEVTAKTCGVIKTFCQEVLSRSISEEFPSWSRSDQKAFLIQQLNRPLRVCGMVTNTGEAGGGPFWVRHSDGSLSLQIVESTQVDPRRSSQQAILKSSSHFNPVDLVCGLKDVHGKSFNLSEFADPNTGIISRKSQEGRELKALELPGLWNGAMAHWNTLFVEVPHLTFSPVKTVFDLLRPEHQPDIPCGRS